ncbi:STAS domain-containing protein [Micromonospora zhanjiangensis]|uniref:STAS domain-containing protein n=1 Tax=Micromonospora zhanjiangensis TaxID=1522057 RepID=A0ABV8KVS4_9ACTN
MTAVHTRFAIGARITRADIPVLCAELAALLRRPDRGVVLCDTSAVIRADVVTVEALARLRLTAGRHGWRLVVGGADPTLLQIVALLGLTDLLGPADDLLSPADLRTEPGREAGPSAEPGREAEQREQPGRVEEVVDRRDPAGG